MRKEVGRKWYQSIDFKLFVRCPNSCSRKKVENGRKNTEEEKIEVEERIMRHANTVKKG